MSKCARVIAIFVTCLPVQPVAWAQQAQEGPGVKTFGWSKWWPWPCNAVCLLEHSLWFSLGSGDRSILSFPSGAAFRESISGV